MFFDAKKHSYIEKNSQTLVVLSDKYAFKSNFVVLDSA